jgi:uncharacterized membrane protein YbhN (UPF0104 family)
VAEPETAVGGEPTGDPTLPTPPIVPPPDPPGWRRHLVRIARLLAVLVVGYFVIATTVHQWSYVREAFIRLSWPVLVAATGLATLSVGAAAMAWRSALTDLYRRVPLTDAAEVFLLGQLGKYVPGSVWAYVAQMELGRRVGVPRSRGLLASLIATLLGITGGLIVGSIGLRTIGGAGGVGPTLRTVTLALLPGAIVCAHPWVLSRLVGLALRVTRREPLARPVSWRGVLRTIAWSLVGYALAGAHLWLLSGAHTRGALLASTAAFALAITAGTFAFLLPSGIGVREFTIAAALAGAGVPFGRAYALALVSRLLFTVADAGAAGVGGFFALRRVRAGDQSQAAP